MNRNIFTPWSLNERSAPRFNAVNPSWTSRWSKTKIGSRFQIWHLSDVPPTVSDPNISENPNWTAVDLEKRTQKFSVWPWKCSIRMFREFSRFFKFVGTDSAQFKTAGCSWLHWRHSSGSSRLSRQSADYLVDQLQILSGSADFTNWSKVLRQFIRKSTFIQWLVKYQFHPYEVIFDRKNLLNVKKTLTAKAKSSQVPKYSEFLERATVYIFISTVLRGRSGPARSCQDTLYDRNEPRHSAISGLGPKYSRNWNF